MIELVSGGVYWVRSSYYQMIDGVPVQVIREEPVLAQFYEAKLSNGILWRRFHYFSTDNDDRPEEVIVVAGPIDIPPPPESEGDPQ
jgi:hypothetical protein